MTHTISNSTIIKNLDYLFIFSYTKLRDDPSLRWRDEIVSEVVLQTIESQDIDTVITFDCHGSVQCTVIFVTAETVAVKNNDHINILRLDGLKDNFGHNFILPT